jgi:hypothetical protein
VGEFVLKNFNFFEKFLFDVFWHHDPYRGAGLLKPQAIEELDFSLYAAG